MIDNRLICSSQTCCEIKMKMEEKDLKWRCRKCNKTRSLYYGSHFYNLKMNLSDYLFNKYYIFGVVMILK